MRFFVAAVALATTAFAQTEGFNPIFTPLKDETIAAGSTYEITWEAPEAYLDEIVKISLIGGADDASLVPIADITSGIVNSVNSFSWTVDASLGEAATYGIVIAVENNESIFQYSNPFHIEAGSGEDAPDAPSDSVSAGVTVTTATGVATVTLTSCPPTSTPITTSSLAPNTTISTSTPTWNTTTLVTLPPPAVTTSVIVTPPAPTEPAPTPEPTTPEPVPTAAAARYVTGPVALVGGLAMAMLL